MSPGVLTRETPCLTASPLLGSTSPAYPSGIASETPVPTTARPPGLRSAPPPARPAPPPPGPGRGPLDRAQVVPGVPRVRPLGDPGVGHEAAESYAQGSFGRHTAGHVSTRARGGQPDRGEGARGAGALAPEAFTKLVFFAHERKHEREETALPGNVRVALRQRAVARRTSSEERRVG